MQMIQPIEIENTSGNTRRLLETMKSEQGAVSNMFRTMAQSAGVLDGYLYFVRALEETNLDPVLAEQIALTVAQADECEYSLALHTVRARRLGLVEEEILAIREGRAANPKTAAVLKFVRSLTLRNRDYQVADLRKHGYTDADIINIVACVGLHSFSNLFNMVARTDVDFPKAGNAMIAA
jgi:AhpD family alkylhydroperoxidase